MKYYIKDYERIMYLLQHTESFSVDGVIKESLYNLLFEYKRMYDMLTSIEDKVDDINEILEGYYDD